jgi:hypothetical protein
VHWLGGPISAFVGVLGTWLYAHFPGLSSMLGQAQAEKDIAAVIVFGVTTGLTAFFHNKVVSRIVEDVEHAIPVQGPAVIPTGHKP